MDTPCFEEQFGLIDPDSWVRFYERGQAIYRHGDAITGVYCIQSGSIAVFAKGPDGRELQLYVAGTGDLLGIPEIMGKDRFECTAICIAPTAVCYVPHARFMEFVQQKPERSVVLMKQICRRIEQVENAL